MQRKVATAAIHSVLIGVLICCVTVPAGAHAPFLEPGDVSAEAPFEISGSIEKSRAVYAWLESPDDVDVYAFTAAGGERLYVTVLVPCCDEYEGFRPVFTLVGPGLASAGPLPPFELPDGYGAVTAAYAPGDRETFFEPFSCKGYYRGPVYTRDAAAPGRWYVVYWNRDRQPGDYVAVVGFQERFSPADIVRTLYLLPLLWFDGELHVPCR